MEEYEVLVVDDDSPDGTAAVVESYATSHPRVRLIRRITDKGLSSAVLEGFRHARGEILGVMDADLSHDPIILPQLLREIQNGAELAVGSRRVPGGGSENWPWFRRLTSEVATRLAKSILRVTLSDPMSGYFFLRREIFERAKHQVHPRGYKILLEIVSRAKPTKIREVPFIFKDRTQSYSKLSGFVILSYLEMLWDLKFGSRPLATLREKYHRGRYAKVKSALGPGNLLDIGCGRPCESMPDGAFLLEVARGTGLDIKPCNGSFEFCQGNVLSLPFEDSSFDNVVAMEVLGHVDDVPRALSEIYRVLKPGGTFLLSTPDSGLLWNLIWSVWQRSIGVIWHEAHHSNLTKRRWREELENFFRVNRTERHWFVDLILRARKEL